MRLPFEPTLVDEGLLTPGQPWRAVRFLAETRSTNDVARDLVAAYAADPGGAPDPGWCVVVTDHQTGGRGRLGRVWEVPAGAAVAVSAVVPLNGAAQVASAAWLPLCAGLALSRAIRQVTRAAGHELTPILKWPNDVLLVDDDDRKVSGILCELVSVGVPLRTRAATNGLEREAAAAVVVGVGVNVDQTRAELPVATATSLALAGVSVRRESLVVAYLRELGALLGAASALGVESSTTQHPASSDLERVVRGAYEDACSTIGARVRVHLPDGSMVEGDAVGLDGSGALVVSTPMGRRSFSAGDVVHVRRPDGRLA
ncbi:MAG: biotin--[acetyl-CoA-carboxylase] ligase [Humibacillus sp.]|nr:biotin--[acetyl-CoA-carboxylase] ligase [Humibacillus sp.]MDN5779169.1 biotin--[acetyl-CoA-carboxylase] ligase [Humibacillus sp.]